MIEKIRMSMETWPTLGFGFRPFPWSWRWRVWMDDVSWSWRVDCGPFTVEWWGQDRW